MRFYFSVVLASLVIFIIDPGLDLTVSALFYRPEVGFIYRDLAWVRWSYSLFAWLQFPILGLLAVGFIAGFFNPQWLVRRKALWFLLLSLLLGPGLAVNEGLKKYPDQIELTAESLILQDFSTNAAVNETTAH